MLSQFLLLLVCYLSLLIHYIKRELIYYFCFFFFFLINTMLQRCFKEVETIPLSQGGASIKSTWGTQIIPTSLKEDSGNERQIVWFRYNSEPAVKTASRFHNLCQCVMPSSEAKGSESSCERCWKSFSGSWRRAYTSCPALMQQHQTCRGCPTSAYFQFTTTSPQSFLSIMWNPTFD